MKRTYALWGTLLLLSGAAVAGSLYTGAGDLGDESLRATFLRLRALRTAAGFGAGACLAVAGVLVQALFRNPLAGPSIVGATAGATLGGQLALLGGQGLIAAGVAARLAPEMLVPIGAIAGALFALSALLLIVRGSNDPTHVLLAGFLLSSLFLSIGAFALSLAQDTWELGRAVLSFTLGGVSGRGPGHVAIVATALSAGLAAAMLWAPSLDVLLSGDDEASTLGVDVATTRRWGIVWTAVLSGGAVAVAGNVAFVGLIVPHAIRPFAGVMHRRLLPAVAVAGGLFVVTCDVATRLISVKANMPLGVITGLIGAPLFLLLLRRSQLLGESHG